MTSELKNKVAVVTGGSRGIGFSIAQALLVEGAQVFICSRNQKTLDAALAKLRTTAAANVDGSCADVRVYDDCRKLIRVAAERFGGLDILVNNAGVQSRSLTADCDDDAWQMVIQTNLIGTFLITKYFLKTMIPRKSGRIINILSVNAKVGHTFGSAYASSKHGLLGLTRSLALEMGFLNIPGITVNAICPGAVQTEMMEGEGGLLDFVAKARGISKEEAVTVITDMNVQKRMLDPEEIAGMALYLASDDARGITGQAINVCCGQVMY